MKLTLQTEWQTFVDACGFMNPVIEQGMYYCIETSHGGWIVPADVCSAPTLAGFADYVEGEIYNPDEPAIVQSGWLARMSAPGYQDCTDWGAYDTCEGAMRDLIDNYGE